MFESIDFRLVAIGLYAILWPFVIHYFIRRKIIPWSGGAFLMMSDSSLRPIDWRYNIRIPKGSAIKGIFLAGARANHMPLIEVNPFPQESFKNPDFRLKRGCFRPLQEPHGVSLTLVEPLGGTEVKFCDLRIDYFFPWIGAADDGTRNMVTINFD